MWSKQIGCYYVIVSGGRTYRRNRRQLQMVPQSVYLPVEKQEAEPLQSVPQSEFHPAAKPATEPLQSGLQTNPLLWNLLLNMWKLRPLLPLQGTVVLSNHQPVFMNLRFSLFFSETLFWTLLLFILRGTTSNFQKFSQHTSVYKGERVIILHKLACISVSRDIM